MYYVDKAEVNEFKIYIPPDSDVSTLTNDNSSKCDFFEKILKVKFFQYFRDLLVIFYFKKRSL